MKKVVLIIFILGLFILLIGIVSAIENQCDRCEGETPETITLYFSELKIANYPVSTWSGWSYPNNQIGSFKVDRLSLNEVVLFQNPSSPCTWQTTLEGAIDLEYNNIQNLSFSGTPGLSWKETADVSVMLYLYENTWSVRTEVSNRKSILTMLLFSGDTYSPDNPETNKCNGFPGVSNVDYFIIEGSFTSSTVGIAEGGWVSLTPSAINVCTEACRNLSYLPNNVKSLIDKGISKNNIFGICTNGYDLDTDRATDYQWGKNNFVTFLKNSNIILPDTPSETIWSPQTAGFSDDNLNGENYCYETKTSRDHNLYFDFGAHDDCACYISGNCIDNDTDGYGDNTSIPWSCEKGTDDCWDYSDTNFNFKNYPYVFEDLNKYKDYFSYGYLGSDKLQQAKDEIIKKYKEIYNKISSTKPYSAYVNPGIEEGKDLYPDQILKLTYGSLAPGVTYMPTYTTGNFFLSACKGGVDEDCDDFIDCYDSGCYDSLVCTDSCGKACDAYAKSVGKTSSGSYCLTDANSMNSDASTEIAKLPLKDYSDCKIPNTCVCKLTKEGTCDYIYGEGNWVPCPSGTTDPTKCCPSTPKYPQCTCCEENKKADPNCCTDSKETCVGYDKYEKNINFCSPFICPAERPVQCLAKDYPNDFGVNWCCKSGDECSLQVVYSLAGIPIIKNPICVRNNEQKECNADEQKCGEAKPDKGVLCCDKEKEECNDISDAKNFPFGPTEPTSQPAR